MEDLIYNHYKNNLVIPGMKICTNDDEESVRIQEYVTVLNVEIDVSINKKFNKNLEKDIIIDILVETELGYIAIFIKINSIFGNSGKFFTDNYKELNIFSIYYIDINDYINKGVKWEKLNKMLKIEKKLPNGTFVEYGMFYFGKNSKPYKVDNYTYQVKCYYRENYNGTKVRIVTLEFDLSKKYISERRIHRCFDDINDVVQSDVSFGRLSENLFTCETFFDPIPYKLTTNKDNILFYKDIKTKLNKMKQQEKPVQLNKED